MVIPKLLRVPKAPRISHQVEVCIGRIRYQTGACISRERGAMQLNAVACLYQSLNCHLVPSTQAVPNDRSLQNAKVFQLLQLQCVADRHGLYGRGAALTQIAWQQWLPTTQHVQKPVHGFTVELSRAVELPRAVNGTGRSCIRSQPDEHIIHYSPQYPMNVLGQSC